MQTAFDGVLLCMVSVALRGRPAKRIGSCGESFCLPWCSVQLLGSIKPAIWPHACSIKLLMGCMGVPDTLYFFPASILAFLCSRHTGAAAVQCG